MFSKFESATITSFGEYGKCYLSSIKSKPSYPKEAIRLLRNVLGIISGKNVLDLAAGTGKLSESLLDTNIQLKAIEPEEETRRIYANLFPQITLLNGEAESIPLPENSIDVVLLGTPFHCFNETKVLSEIVRVLKSKGGLGLIWNVIDDNIEWVKKTYHILDEIYENQLPYQGSWDWKTAFNDNSNSFLPLQHRTISFSYLGKVSHLIDNLLSTHCVFSLSQEKQDYLTKEICQLLELPMTKTNENELLIPYRTEIYWSFKSESAMHQ